MGKSNPPRKINETHHIYISQIHDSTFLPVLFADQPRAIVPISRTHVYSPHTLPRSRYYWKLDHISPAPCPARTFPPLHSTHVFFALINDSLTLLTICYLSVSYTLNTIHLNLQCLFPWKKKMTWSFELIFWTN